jgi:hypothetical protein
MPETAEVATRKCTTCGQVKPITEFSPHKHYRGGRRWHCRACGAADFRRWRQENLAYARRRDLRYRARQNASRRTLAARRKQEVRKLSLYAVRLGVIARKYNCEKCGIDARHAPLHRHHPDYNNPLNVVWLCAVCHGEMHRKQFT